MSDVPVIFGRYQLLEPIAKGGMAEVFRARLVAAAGTQKVLCIKRILPTLSQNREFISLFVQEAKIALTLTHGNITQVFDFGEVDGVYYLAMEYISGQDLSAVLRRFREVDGRLDLPAVLYVAAEVCKGLQYAHAVTDAAGKTHVVHRDVTPHNILISYSGQVKLTDFGIALAATKVAPAGKRVVRGKACYLSPEQIEGHPGEPRSDIFSLGTVLYEMLTGIRPFEASDEKETLERIRSLEVAPPSHFNEDVDDQLNAVVLKALARDPERRFRRGGDLQVALTQILHQRWPEYTAEKLAETMRDIFSWELSQMENPDSDSVRDRLLFQLSRAGVKVDGKKATTSELLDMGTVAIGEAGAPAPVPEDRRKLLWGVGGAIALAVMVLTGILIAYAPDGKRSAASPDAGLTPVPTIVHQTEHLATPSMKRQMEENATTPAGSDDKQLLAKPRKVAYLNCNSWPWSVVYINGRRLRGNTPLYRVKVSAGRHRIRFFNPELGLSKEVSVTVGAGAQKTVAVSLQQ